MVDEIAMKESLSSWHSHCSVGRISPAWLFIFALLLNGCMAGKTRSLPFTEYPPEEAINLGAGKFTIEVNPFDISSTDIKGGHYEGLLQVRQPWIWGLSKEQKESLYGDLGNIVRYAIIDEFLGPVRGLFADGDPKVRIERMICQGPIVATEARGIGQLKNGKKYDNHYAFVIEIKDDKIFALREYMDSYHVSTLM